jgi:uncharacterized oxidoreductase
MAGTLVFEPAALRAAVAAVIAGFGSTPAECDEVARNLVEANLAGHDSHGVGMVPRYVEGFLEGGLTPNAKLRVEVDTGALLRLDGQAGFGQVIGREAMEMGIERARAHGVCAVALGNAHHLGRIGAWAEQAVAAGLVSIHFVNVVARPIVAPHGGADARFGTNPFTAGVPLRGRPPMILDFATSMIAQGKTRVAHNKGEPVPEGCLIDDQGRPTTDPRWSVTEPPGAILPFGLHKGYGLAVLCELLGGALAGGQTGHREQGTRRRVLNGMLSVLIDPRALGDPDRFETEALDFATWVTASPARAGFGPVQLAGDPERALRERRLREGIPVDPETGRQILEAGGRLGVPAEALGRLGRPAATA